MKEVDRKLLLDQLRYRYRRETKLELIHEFQRQQERENLVPEMPLSFLQRKKRGFEISFAILTGLYLGAASVLLMFILVTAW